MTTGRPVVVAPEEGHSVAVGGLGVVKKLSGSDTGGAYSVVEDPLQLGALAPPPHTHAHEDEISFVVEGEIGVLLGDEEFRAGPGTYVVKPRGVPHTFWNPGSRPARLVEIISPAGFERYFAELAAIVHPADGGVPDLARVAELGARYGLTFHMERVPALIERHGLTLG